MSYGPIDTFEVVWASGHVETVQAHQVLMPQTFTLFGDEPPERRWTFHGEIDGRWRLILTAQADDIRSVRNLTHTHDGVGEVS